MNRVLCVFMREDTLKSSLLVAIEIKIPFVMSAVLDEYAEKYGIERQKLFGIVATVIKM